MNDNKDAWAIIIGVLTIIISNFIGSIAPPFSITLSPIIMIIIIGGINSILYTNNFKQTIVYGFGLLVFNDILIRLFAGGIHDAEGKGWIILCFLITSFVSIIIMIGYGVIIARQNNKFDWIKIIYNILTISTTGIVAGIFYYFINSKM